MACLTWVNGWAVKGWLPLGERHHLGSGRRWLRAGLQRPTSLFPCIFQLFCPSYLVFFIFYNYKPFLLSYHCNCICQTQIFPALCLVLILNHLEENFHHPGWMPLSSGPWHFTFHLSLAGKCEGCLLPREKFIRKVHRAPKITSVCKNHIKRSKMLSILNYLSLVKF